MPCCLDIKVFVLRTEENKKACKPTGPYVLLFVGVQNGNKPIPILMVEGNSGLGYLANSCRMWSVEL